MFTTEDYKRRLARAAQGAITDTPDGRPWYGARAICQALSLDPAASFPKVRRENKYLRLEALPCARGIHLKTRQLYLSRAGVETLLMLKGGLPRAELLAALDEGTPGWP